MAYTNKDITIIIPNWNGKKLLESFLPSIMKNSQGASLIIVDDNSTDDSLGYVKQTFPQIHVMEKKFHEGFSSTVNLGVSAAKTPLVLLLNTDIEPLPGYLDPVLPHFNNENVFAVGLKDRSIEKGSVVYRGRGIAWFHDGMFMHKRGEIDSSQTAWVSCGSGMFRKSIWEQLGGLDTIYNPFYWEDIDLSYRALKSGYTLYFESESEVLHHHEKGAILTHMSPSSIKAIAFRNQLLFMWKNIHDKKILFNHVFFLPIHIVRSLLHKDTSFLNGFFHALRLLPQCIKSRSKVSSYWKLSDKEVISSIQNE